jgi:hypothetical protein
VRAVASICRDLDSFEAAWAMERDARRALRIRFEENSAGECPAERLERLARHRR